MRTFGSSIVTAIVTATAFQVTPAFAEVVTVCGTPSHASTQAGRIMPPVLASPLQRLGAQDEAEIDHLLALWRDDEGFDILLQWGESGQHSLRQQGADIIGASPTLDFIHLVVGRAGQLEHFLFSLDEQGSGELLRSGAEEDVGEASAVSSNAICVRPK
jgi:hypothetical protein